MASQSHMALVEGARNNHVLSHSGGGLMRLQERSKVKGLGSFARVVEAVLQSMPLSDCGFHRGAAASSPVPRAGTGSSRRIGKR